VIRIRELELQRMSTGREIELDLGLSPAEMPHVLVRGQRKRLRRQLVEIDEQVMVTRVFLRDTRWRYTHALEAETDDHR